MGLGALAGATGSYRRLRVFIIVLVRVMIRETGNRSRVARQRRQGIGSKEHPHVTRG